MGVASMARRKPSEGTGVKIPLTPSAAEVRAGQSPLGLPSAGSVWHAAAGGLGGAVMAATLITIMPNPTTRWLGALLGLGTGTILAATSPAGTIPQEMGVGTLALSGGWMVFDLFQPHPLPTTPAWLITGG